MNVSVAPLRNANGRVVSAVVVVADVSDQKRAELALRESEVRFRSLVQNSTDMVTIVGEGGRVAYRSPSAWRFLGLDPETDPDVPVDFGLFEEDRPALTGAVRTRAAPCRAPPETIQYRFYRADGELRSIEMVATNHSVPTRRARRRHERGRHRPGRSREPRFAHPEERLSGLVANISDVVSVIDADGVLKYTSPTSERVYGYKPGEWPEGQSI